MQRGAKGGRHRDLWPSDAPGIQLLVKTVSSLATGSSCCWQKGKTTQTKDPNNMSHMFVTIWWWWWPFDDESHNGDDNEYQGDIDCSSLPAGCGWSDQWSDEMKTGICSRQPSWIRWRSTEISFTLVSLAYWIESIRQVLKWSLVFEPHLTDPLTKFRSLNARCDRDHVLLKIHENHVN